MALRRRGLGRFNNSSYRHGDSDLLAAELAELAESESAVWPSVARAQGYNRAENIKPQLPWLLWLSYHGVPKCGLAGPGAVRWFVASSLAKHMPAGGGGWDLCRCCGYSSRSTRKLGFLRCKLQVFCTPTWLGWGDRLRQ